VRVGLSLPRKALSYKYTLDQTGSELLIHDLKYYPSFYEAQILSDGFISYTLIKLCTFEKNANS
jgi:hypothetical protein